MSVLDDLVEDMAFLFDAPCTLEDPGFRLIGFSDQRRSDTLDAVRRRSILERGSTDEVRSWFDSFGIRDATGPVRTPSDPERGITARLCVPARHLGRTHGYFWLLESEHPTDDGLWPDAMRIADAAASLLSLVENRQGRRDGLYREVVEGRAGDARRAATELAAAIGMDVHEPVCCVLVQRPDLVEQLASRASRPGLVWVREDSEVSAAVVRAGVLEATAELPDVLAALGLGRRVSSLDTATYVGVGPVAAGLDELMHARSGARVALRVSRATGPGTVIDWADLGVVALLGVARDDDLARTLLTPTLEQFLREASEDLVETARVYLDEAGSASRAAERLAVHRQTVYHRLSHVERLTACDLDLGRDRLRLQLALQLGPFLLNGPS